MQGIPVRPNGDPVRRTFVIARDYIQFRDWCMYSRVNPRSRNVMYLTNRHQLMGCRDIDLVRTGESPSISTREWDDIAQALHMLRALSEIKNDYAQYESSAIEPNVIYDPQNIGQLFQLIKDRGPLRPE